jgi:hypothetical protein
MTNDDNTNATPNALDAFMLKDLVDRICERWFEQTDGTIAPTMSEARDWLALAALALDHAGLSVTCEREELVDPAALIAAAQTVVDSACMMLDAREGWVDVGKRGQTADATPTAVG